MNPSIHELPAWLDKYIFEKLGAKYQPSYDRFSYNLDLNKEESRIYLGTYFPRSFAEEYLIFNTLFQDEVFCSQIKNNSSIKILDFGCGSGGEIFGLLHVIETHISHDINIKIVGIDGNENALRIFEKIVEQYNLRGKNRVDVQVVPCFIGVQSDLLDISEIIGTDFDFIITSKAIGEFERKQCLQENGYEFFANLFAPLLADTGIMSILDVTIKDPVSGMFLPRRLNAGVNRFLARHSPNFKSIAPCTGLSKTGYCEHQCFYKKEIYITHSAKVNDISKFAVRIIARDGLQINSSVFQNELSNQGCHTN